MCASSLKLAQRCNIWVANTAGQGLHSEMLLGISQNKRLCKAGGSGGVPWPVAGVGMVMDGWMAFPWIAARCGRDGGQRGKNVLGLLQEIPALCEELLSFGAAVRSACCTLGGFSLKMHFLLSGPGFSLQNPPDPSSFPALFPGSVACGAGPGPSARLCRLQ